GPDLVKPNRAELAEAVGSLLLNIGDVIAAAQQLRRWGAGSVLASLGADGAVLVDDEGVLVGECPVVEPRSAVGAGDAMLAGFLAAGARGEKALAEGLAWGAAAVLLPGSRMPGPFDIHRDPVRIYPGPNHSRALVAADERIHTSGPPPGGTGWERSTPMAMPYTPAVTGTGVKARVQRLGGHLAGMVMPNIASFIAWGLITALFIPTGWMPNAKVAVIVSPIITVLLPVLIGYTGGRMVHGQRGAVVGAVATLGVVVGSDVPMLLGAMIVGPLTAYLLKQVDRFTQERTRSGFEMLVDNFSAGIIGRAVAVAGVYGLGPVVRSVTNAAGYGVNWLISHHLLAFASFLIEPGKVLFLNNAINHGVLGPLGVAQAAAHGKSVLFMLESNPGPGLGILLAYMLF